MSQYFDSHTCSEWSEQHLRPLEEAVEDMEARQRRLVAESVWPRRPIQDDAKEDEVK